MKLINNPPRQQWKDLCKRPTLDHDKLDKAVEVIYQGVEAQGDLAIQMYTKRFDGIDLASIEISPVMTQELASNTPINLMRAIDTAYDNILKFHTTQRVSIDSEMVETMPGVSCWRESRPIETVGLYVPGGSAPLISTVLMLGIPAQIAGCKQVVLCTPPNKQAMIEPAICYAALKIGATKMLAIGGAQAIASMAIGTKSVPKVDKIFGPGNQYVTAAKQLAVRYGVGIDMPAGPSELMILADMTANPAFVAADLLSQAEHGPDSQVVLVATSGTIADSAIRELDKQLNLLPRKMIATQAIANSFCVVLDSLDVAIDFANSYAPEHLILSVKAPGQLAKKVCSAGSVFLGNYSPESAGDYASGTNHTLPTNGWARSYGGVSLDSFVKKITFQEITKAGLHQLGPTIVSLADAENLSAHANAVTIRTKNNL